MNILLNVCNTCFNIKIKNRTVFNYLKNRYFGFVSQIELSQDLLQTSIIEDSVLKNLVDDMSILGFRDGVSEFTNNDSRYVIIIASGAISVIKYMPQKAEIRLFIDGSMPERMLKYIGVKLCEIINSILIKNGTYCIHASVCTALKNENDGIAFLGQSGAGKSTISYMLCKRGEKTTNDDVAYFQITCDGMCVYRNTQLLGLDDSSIEITFEECKNYIVHKDESDFDKNRIDLNLMDSSYFANSITVKTFIIIEKERFIKPRIMRCSPIETYRVLIQSLLPYFSVDNHMVMREVADTLFQNIPAYRLYASKSIVTTADYILGYFKEGKNALQ